MDVVSAPEVQVALGQLESQLRATMEEEEIPGLSAAIVYNQDTIWAKGFGYANREAQAPATPDTPYRIASITKVFTTTMLMRLRDAGRLQLDDAVVKYLPEYKVKSRFRDAPPTTLRQLASHTAGLPAEAPNITFATTEYPNAAAFLASLADVEIIIPLGSEIKYSNLGIAILGHALERAAAQPYGEYLRANILAPLGMNRSGLYLDVAMSEQAAIGYVPEDAPFTATLPDFDSAALAPAEQMYTSVADIARFIALQFRDGDNPAGDAQILAGSSLREMHAPVALDPDWQTGIGIGFALQRLADYTAVVATGGYLGYASNIMMLPALKLGVAIFANYLTDAEGITRAALELLQPAFSAAIDRAESLITAPTEWQKYVGFYAYPGHKGIDITIEKGKLVITSRLSGNTYRYLPEGENLWRGQGGRVAGELLRFDTNTAGEALRADMGNEVFERQALSPLLL